MNDVERHPLSRRNFVGAAGLLALLGAGGTDFLTAAGASATVVQWNHPFTRRFSITPDGNYLNHAQWRIDDGLGPHSGIDLNAPGGEPIYNCAPGTVRFAGSSGSWGYHVKIEHADGTYTGYAHMRPGSVAVSQGQVLNSTTKIGLVGSSGSATGEHLHLARMTSLSTSDHIDPTDLATASPAVPGAVPTIQQGDDEMRMIQAPNGSLAIISAYYAAEYSGSDTIGVSANLAAWGPLISVDAASYARLISDANSRRTALLAEIASA